MEKCANCERPIGNLETPRIHNNAVVCEPCFQKLQAQSAPLSPPNYASPPQADVVSPPRSPYRNGYALASYYIGLFSLFPCLGAFMGPTAIFLGIKGLKLASAKLPTPKEKHTPSSASSAAPSSASSGSSSTPASSSASSSTSPTAPAATPKTPNASRNQFQVFAIHSFRLDWPNYVSPQFRQFPPLTVVPSRHRGGFIIPRHVRLSVPSVSSVRKKGSKMPKILAFAGSLRKESYNKKLVKVAAHAARNQGAEVTLIDLKDFPLPIFDEDIEAQGLPENARKLKDLFLAHNALLVSCPEYNSSITAVLKNTIDWVSRPVTGEYPLECFDGKVAALLSASPGPLGGLRGLVIVRSLLSNIKVTLLPDQFALTNASTAFDNDGFLKDPKQLATVEAITKKLTDVAGKIHG